MNSGHRQPTLTAAPHLPLLFLILIAGTSTAQSNSNSNSNGANNPYFGTTNFSPSMAIVIVVLISAFFFLGFFSIYIRQCSGDRNSSIRASVANAGRSRRNRGLNQEALDSFPTFLYSEVKERKIGKGSLECAVCLSEFEDDETLRLLPECSHIFHHDCIDAWLAAHVTCPVCRSNLVPDPNADQELVPPVVESVNADTERTDQELPVHHVTVEIDEEVDEEHHDVIENLERFVNMKRAKSRARPAVFPRSHSTGHSVVLPGENLDRFTLRLPEEVRREIVEASSNNNRFKRTTSLLVFNTEEGSVGRARPRMGRSGRFGSFLMRTFSVRNWGMRGGDEGGSSRRGGFSRTGEPGSSSVKRAARFNGVIAPFDCYGGGKGSAVDENEGESSTAALNRV